MDPTRLCLEGVLADRAAQLGHWASASLGDVHTDEQGVHVSLSDSSEERTVQGHKTNSKRWTRQIKPSRKVPSKPRLQFFLSVHS